MGHPSRHDEGGGGAQGREQRRAQENGSRKTVLGKWDPDMWERVLVIAQMNSGSCHSAKVC